MFTKPPVCTSASNSARVNILEDSECLCGSYPAAFSLSFTSQLSYRILSVSNFLKHEYFLFPDMHARGRGVLQRYPDFKEVIVM